MRSGLPIFHRADIAKAQAFQNQT